MNNESDPLIGIPSRFLPAYERAHVERDKQLNALHEQIRAAAHVVRTQNTMKNSFDPQNVTPEEAQAEHDPYGPLRFSALGNGSCIIFAADGRQVANLFPEGSWMLPGEVKQFAERLVVAYNSQAKLKALETAAKNLLEGGWSTCVPGALFAAFRKALELPTKDISPFVPDIERMRDDGHTYEHIAEKIGWDHAEMMQHLAWKGESEA